jgi:hypothetical protein
MIETFMTVAACGYFGAAISYAASGQPWMAITMLLYMLSIATVFMAGTQ